MLIGLVGWLAGWSLTESTSLADYFLQCVFVLATCAVVVLFLVFAYPRAWWETVCVSLLLGAVLAFLPVMEALVADAKSQSQNLKSILLIVGFLIGGLFLWLGLHLLQIPLLEIPFGAKFWTSRIRIDMPADKAFQILRLNPDSDNGFYRAGPADEEGVFSVFYVLNSVEPETFEPTVEEFAFKCKIQEEGESHQVTLNIYEIDGKTYIDTQYLSVRR